MNILIADDEHLARMSLKSMLQEAGLPLEAMKEATNGEELIDLARLHKPLLAFVDIRMPRLNGLEAIKQAKLLSPQTRWFILTGFSEFQHAHDALRIGVSDYLLKPIGPTEIHTIITKVTREHRQHLLDRNKQFAMDLTAIYHGVSPLSQKEQDDLLQHACFIGTIFCIDTTLSAIEKATRQDSLLQTVQPIIDEMIVLDFKMTVFMLSNGEIALIGTWGSEDANQGMQHCLNCLYQIEQTVCRPSDTSFDVTLLQTSVCPSYKDLFYQFNWLQQFSSLRVIYGIGKKIQRRDLLPYAGTPRFLAISKLVSTLTDYYRQSMYVNYMSTLDRFMKACVEERAIDYGVKKSVAEFLSQMLPCQISPQQDLADWYQILKDCGEHLLHTQPHKEAVGLVEWVIESIEQEYHANISIAQIAVKLGVSPNYLSTLFHKKTGMTFVRYVTKVRMLKAKELLNNPSLQVQQVAEQVGYYSVRHFTKVFTEFFGYYPSAQRKKRDKNTTPAQVEQQP
ncbi:response regulator transcription factor [Ktedonobacter robiniae]|uniref:DNA-binding response regulator n=1 Tax=Ktedonobacter robiniae TaxID=2778365 RepID=A0ABQ3UH95_9CHLR|nr:response regulator [Ktedonobacter robiniae]GHO51822.1 hypothetical protein KSB_02970 [Ktedonobacter robiniae]